MYTKIIIIKEEQKYVPFFWHSKNLLTEIQSPIQKIKLY